MDLLLAIHLVAVIMLAATNIGALVTTVLARRSSNPGRILRLLAVHHLFAAKLLVPAAVATLLSGAWLTYRSGASLLAPWMLGTLVLYIASALVGVLYLLPEEAIATAEARRQTQAMKSRPRTSSSRTSRHLASSPEWAAQVTMAVMFYLMIVQPG